MIRDLHKKEKKMLRCVGSPDMEVKKIVMRCVGSCNMRFKHRKKKKEKSRDSLLDSRDTKLKNRDVLCGLM